MRKILFNVAFILSLCAVSATQIPAAIATTTQLGSLSIITVPLDQHTLTVTPPTSNSPGAWTLSLDNPSLATINGLTLTLIGVGSGQLTFTQAATGAYTSASRTTVFRVTPGTPTLGTWGPLSVPLSANQFKILPPTSNSAGTWSYTLANNYANGYQIASLSGNVVTLLDGGTVTITAQQGATSTFKSAVAQTTLLISGFKPIIGPFADITLSRDSVGSFNLKTPTSTSPGLWTFTSSQPGIAVVSGTLVTPVGVGTTIITAHQSPASGFQSATVTMNLTVTATAPTIGALAPINYILGSNSNNTVTITPPTSNSTGQWVFKVTDPSIATISGNTLTILKAGTTTISAEQNPTANFGYSTLVTAPLTVNQKTTLSPLPNLNQVVGDPAIQITPPTSPSSGAWILSSSDSSVASVSGLTITVGNAGTATLTLTQSADGIWLANSTSFTVTVAGLVPTIGTLTPITLDAGTTLATIPNPTSNSTGVWSYSTGNSAIAKIVNGTLVGVAPGTTTLSGVQRPAGKYGQSNTVQTTITVKPAPIPTPTPTPTKTPTPTPTPKPTPSKTIIPTKKHPTKTPVVPIVSAKAVGRTIHVTSNNPKVIVIINGVVGKIGTNVVHAGNDLVIIEFSSKVIYSRVFTVK